MESAQNLTEFLPVFSCHYLSFLRIYKMLPTLKTALPPPSNEDLRLRISVIQAPFYPNSYVRYGLALKIFYSAISI